MALKVTPLVFHEQSPAVAETAKPQIFMIKFEVHENVFAVQMPLGTVPPLRQTSFGSAVLSSEPSLLWVSKAGLTLFIPPTPNSSPESGRISYAWARLINNTQCPLS